MPSVASSHPVASVGTLRRDYARAPTVCGTFHVTPGLGGPSTLGDPNFSGLRRRTEEGAKAELSLVSTP